MAEEEEEAAVGKLNKKNLTEVEDMVSRILSMLPVKSLLICTSVCKDWRRLISSPDFIRLQLNKSKENPNFTPRGRSLAASLEFGDFFFFHRKIISFEFGKELNMWLGAVINGLGFWLSSSGLPELHGRHQIYIHNPATRRVTLVCETRSGRLRPKIAVAFGPDGRLDEYKIYAIFQKSDDCSKHYDCCECEVYCSVTKSWKLIGDVAPAACWVRYSRSVNGIVYWVVKFRRGGGGGGDGIVPLPMAMIAIDWNGSVTTINLPREVTNYDGLLNLVEFEGCLSLIFCHENLFDLWVLKDDGINHESSWVQRCCSAMPFDKKYADSHTYFLVARKNEILFLLRDVKVAPSSYLVYNVDEGTWRAVPIPDFMEPTPCLYDCTESLLPIPCEVVVDKILGIQLD